MNPYREPGKPTSRLKEFFVNRTRALWPTVVILAALSAIGATASLRINGAKFPDGTYAPSGVFNVRAPEFGAKGDGTTDDTSAINAACAAAGANVVYFPSGNYKYTGNGGCTGVAMKFAGQGKDSTIITLSAGNYFVDDNQAWNSFQMRGLRFEGGAGAVRNRSTATAVADYKEIDDCYFNNYTGAAISNNSTDEPYWKITRDVFMGANTTTTIGVALSGYTDANTIQDCEFLNNKIGVKLGRGGNNARVVNGSFLEFSTGTSRAGLWVVPETTLTNSGQGLIVNNVKFGNEFQDTTDYKILYADEGAGTYFGDRLFSTSVSTNFITGHRIAHVLFNGANATTQPLVYSYTAQIAGSQYGPFTIGGTSPTYVVQVNTPPTVDVSATNYGNVIGPITFANSSIPGGLNGWAASNAPSMFSVDDVPQAFTAADPNMVDPWTPGSGPAGYTVLLTTGVRSFTLANGSTLSNISDAAGGTDATEATMPNTGLVYSILNTTPTAGQPMWIEFDAKSGSATPLTNVQVRLQDNSNNIYWRRQLTIPSSTTVWKRYRFLFIPRTVPANFNIMFANNTGASGLIDIGMVRVYHGYEPLGGGQFNGIWNAGASTLSGATTITGALTQSGGAISLTGNAASQISTGTGGLTFGVPTANTFNFQVNSVTKASISANGNVLSANLFDVQAAGAMSLGTANATSITAGKSTVGLTIAATAFASLPAASAGTLIYCNDCTIANPCAGSGTGAIAKRLNGIWVCN